MITLADENTVESWMTEQNRIDREKSAEYTETISSKVTKEMDERINTLSRLSGHTRSTLIRLCVEDALERVGRREVQKYTKDNEEALREVLNPPKRQQERGNTPHPGPKSTKN